MKQPTFNGKELLPLSVMEAAHAGDAMAMEQVLRYYECYINKLCTRTLYDIPLCVRGRVHEAPSGNQAHSFHRQTRDLTTGPRQYGTSYPFRDPSFPRRPLTAP